jgi:predicted ATP-grasp superfamily ATP-dependent carboligase
MDSNRTVLIAAASGRALAASARRAGYAPLVVDFFGDQDTIAVADAHVRMKSGNGRGMNDHELLVAFETLAAARFPCGAVYGTGFEDRPDLLAKIAQRWRLVGNSPDTVARIKDPVGFAELCRRCGISHPQISLVRPADMTGWLAKRAGGAGGTHVRFELDEQPTAGRFYFQRHVEGTPVSALLLADGRRGMPLGFSAQWVSPAPQRPFRYGGAARPAPLMHATADAMTAAIERIISVIPLVGLNSVDFLVDGDQFHLLEINPRPGATFDIFEPPGRSLFALHVAACHGTLPAEPPARDWPDWAADRPAAGSAVNAEAPLCSVFASAAAVSEARRLAHHRAATILANVHARRS